jgi:signal transduction histidine kinase
LALAGNVVNALLPERASQIGAIGLAITSISAVLYYVAFIPPRWMRHAWQYEELRDFLAQTNLTPSRNLRADENFQQLSSAANQAVSGMMGAVVKWDVGKAGWTILGSTDAAITSKLLASGHRIIEKAWQQSQPLSLYVPDIQELEERRPMESVGARTWLLVPIQAPARVWGMLLVILRDRALFIDDDLILLELFAQQSAMVLENNRLIAELQGYSEQLERKVEERTKELQESEAVQRELNATLEQRVAQRTAELERSNGELDQFAYIASHDLKAPLRAISHLVGWIEEDSGELLPDTSREHLAKLQGRVRRMETLLNDLLAYSRVARQRHPVELVNITELIHDVTEIIAPPTGFAVKICGELPVMQVERIPLETVFRNLIGNAVKHHHTVTQGSVEIHARRLDDFVEFVVKDDGPGIAPEYHQRIFEIFQTLQPRDQLEGSGIGLAIVKKSVESRGGSIQVESMHGIGTTFRFTWPQNGHVQWQAR